MVPAGLKTGSDLPYDLFPTYRLCLSLSIPTPISLQQKKTEFRLFLFIFLFFFIITCVPSPLIVFVQLTCPDRLSPIPKIIFEGIEGETSDLP